MYVKLQTWLWNMGSNVKGEGWFSYYFSIVTYREVLYISNKTFLSKIKVCHYIDLSDKPAICTFD